MKLNFIETEINDFKGIATSSRLRAKNDATELLNFDLRERTGELALRNGYQQKYAAPSNARLTNLSILSGENFYLQDYGSGREVTVLVGKATLNRETGSGITPTTLNIPVIFIRPFWKMVLSGQIQTGSTSTLIKTVHTLTADQYKNGYLRLITSSGSPATSYTGNFRKILSHTTGANSELTIDTLPYDPVTNYYYEIWFWSDTWQWLNEMVYTKIITAYYESDTCKLEIHVPNTDQGNNIFVGWTISDLTTDGNAGRTLKRHSTILCDTGTASYRMVAFADHVAGNGDYYDDDLILLQKNFIPLEYLYNLYNIVASDISFYSLLNEIRITFGGQAKRLALALGMRDKSFQIKSFPPSYPVITEQILASVISSKQEIMLDPINVTTETNSKDSYGTYIAAFTEIGVGTFPLKKYFYKITAFLDDHSEFIIVEGNFTVTISTKDMLLTLQIGAAFNKRITAIRLFLSECDTTSDAEATNPFFLVKDITVMPNDLDFTKPYFEYDDNGFLVLTSQIDYVWFTNNLGEMNELLGYTPTINYVNSFDQGLVINKTVFAVNPYSDKRWDNILYYSPVSGDAVFQYDVLMASNYYSAAQFDKDDIIGIGLLNNMDFAVLKRNVFNQMDQNSGVTYQTHYEKGSVARRSIINTGNALVWANENSVIAANTQQVIDISEGSIRDQYRLLTSTQRSNILAAREEKDNAYRFFSGDTTNKTEYVFTKRGWAKQKRTLYPEGFIQARDGNVWFINTNAVYYDVAAFKLDVATGIPFKWKNHIDLSLIGEQIKSTDLFLIDKIWIRYKSTALAFDVKIYFDESGTAFDTMTCAASKIFEQKKIIPGGIGRIVELEITGTTINSTDDLEIYALGIIWASKRVGIYGTT